MELPSHFQQFSEKINLTESMRSELIRGHETLRTRLSQDPRLSSIYVTTFLQGSYRRQTIIRPLDGKRSDVDVVVVTNLDRNSVGAQSALDRFKPFLEQWYPKKFRAQGRSWGIEMSSVDLDLVVTAAPSMAAAAAMRRQNGGDVEETWDSTEALWIPDRKAVSWIQTHPSEQMRWTSAKNKRTNGLYCRVVKALKWWKRRNDPSSHPKGYPFEHLIGDCCPDGITSVAEGVTRTFEGLEKWSAHELLFSRVPELWDRGVQQNVFSRITRDDIRALQRTVAPAARLARQALDSQWDAAPKWRALFGDHFPL